MQASRILQPDDHDATVSYLRTPFDFLGLALEGGLEDSSSASTEQRLAQPLR